ncbi:MAG: phosphotransferase [Propionibacteriaceae bacterium]|nr:phosphotransferase [Propionibacteriaceae bacterium]
MRPAVLSGRKGSMEDDLDGFRLLTTAEVAPLLATAVRHAGGELVDWEIDHVDRAPGDSTVATYTTVVDWAYGRREEVIGVCCRLGGLTGTDTAAELYVAGERKVALWFYPKDPDLPGLAKAAYPQSLAEICNSHKVFSKQVSAEQLSLKMIGYRPRRRAVLKATNLNTGEVVYVKVLREKYAKQISLRHQLLLDAGIPVAQILAATDDHMLILSQMQGTSLAAAIFAPHPPCDGGELIALLDRMPAALANLPRRPPWAESVRHYAEIIAETLPSLRPRLDAIVTTVEANLDFSGSENEATHGDFYEGQLLVNSRKVVGLLDIDTVGPGRRVDDLACLVAHLSTIQHMNASQTQRVHRVIREWVPVFDTRVDPAALRLRAAAVIVSLATGPFRGQEPNWALETTRMVGSAEALIKQIT